MKCPHCKYEWQPKKDNPVSCPRCKRRLDYKIVGLQIGGTVRQNDRVGMYVSMPINPGIGVRIELNSEFDKEVDSILSKLKPGTPKFSEIKTLTEKIKNEKSDGKKIQLLHKLVMMGVGISKIATNIAKISELLGY